MTVTVYTMQTSTISGTGNFTFSGTEPGYQDFLTALQSEFPASPMPTTWANVGYTAYTTTDDAVKSADNEYVDVEVGRGTLTNASPITLSRADGNVDYSTNSNNRVSWSGADTIYIACTLNAYEIINQ